MLTVIIIMSSGMLAGFILRKYRRLFMKLDKLVSVVIYLLLFFLGLSVGQNDSIIRNFHLIGMKAFIITVASVAGSLAAAVLVFRFFFKQDHLDDPDADFRKKSDASELQGEEV